jgi:hypothetical protein
VDGENGASGTIVLNWSVTVHVTIATDPPGLLITVDAGSYTAPQTFNWTPGSAHTMHTPTPQLSAEWPPPWPRPPLCPLRRQWWIPT